MTVQGDADAPAAEPATTPPVVPAELVREVEQLPDGRRITYYGRGAEHG